MRARQGPQKPQLSCEEWRQGVLGKQAERAALVSSEMRSPAAHRLPSALGREGRSRRCWGRGCSWGTKPVSDPSQVEKE